MNPVIYDYRQNVYRSLQCTDRAKKRLMRSFDSLLETYEEDEPSPTPEKLQTSFGPPEQMANSLMHGLSSKERSGWKRNRKIALLAVCVLIIAAVSFTTFLIGTLREPAPVTVVEQTYIYDGIVTSDVPPDLLEAGNVPSTK